MAKHRLLLVLLLGALLPAQGCFVVSSLLGGGKKRSYRSRGKGRAARSSRRSYRSRSRSSRVRSRRSRKSRLRSRSRTRVAASRVRARRTRRRVRAKAPAAAPRTRVRAPAASDRVRARAPAATARRVDPPRRGGKRGRASPRRRRPAPRRARPRRPGCVGTACGEAAPAELQLGVRRRRARTRSFGFSLAVQSGVDLAQPDGATSGVRLGLRFVELLELSCGLHHFVAHLEPERATVHDGMVRLGAGVSPRLFWRVEGYLGGSIGFGLRAISHQASLVAGLRVRLTPRWRVGIFPFNPTYSRYRVEEVLARRRSWTFPTTVQLSYTL